MDERIITLTSLIPTISLENYLEISITRKFKHLGVLSKSGVLSVYLISRKIDCAQRRIWRSSNEVNSFTFSDDGNQMAVVYKQHSCEVFQINETNLELLFAVASDTFCGLLSSWELDKGEIKDISVVSCVKHDIVLCVDKRYLLYLTWRYPEVLNLGKKVHIPSCIYVTQSRDYIFILTVGGNISFYSIENGQNVGTFNIYAVVSNNSEESYHFTAISVTGDGRKIAVADEKSNVFILNAESFFRIRSYQEETWDSSSSTMSMYSGSSSISKSSVNLQKSTIKSDDSVSLNVPQVTRKDKILSYKTTWKTYLNSLAMKESNSQETADMASCLSTKQRTNVCAVKLVNLCNTYQSSYIKSFYLSDGGLRVWFMGSESSLGGMFRIYDSTSGVCIAEVEVPDDAVVVAGGFMDHIDAILSTNKLSMFLGNISRDAFINKIMQCMDTETVSQLLQGEEWKDLTVPLAALSESLKQHQMDVARLSFGLHSQAFKNTFHESPSDENFLKILSNATKNMNDLFHVVECAVKENLRNVAFTSNLILLSLNHAYELIQFLHNKIYSERRNSEISDFMDKHELKHIVTEIMAHVINLRSQLSRYPKEQNTTVNDYQPLDSLSEDSKLLWNSWTSMDDENIVLDSVSKNSVPLAQTYLIKERNWKPQGIMTTMRNIVNKRIHELLRDKDIAQSRMLLTNVGYNSEEELRNIFRKSSERKIRDNVAKYLVDHHSLDPPEIEAWKFILLLEVHLEAVEFSGTSEFMYQTTSKKQKQMQNKEFLGTDQKLTVDVVLKQPPDWKSLVLTEIFFNVPGSHLQALLNPDVTWKYLLRNNRDDILICWIDSYYNNGNPPEESLDCLRQWENAMKDLSYQMEKDNLCVLTSVEAARMFASMEISQSMIDNIRSEDAMQTTKDLVLDHLSRFGVFDSHEKTRISSILRRLARASSLHRLKDILNAPTANISLQSVHQLLTELILKHKLYNLPYVCLEDSKYTEEQIQELCETFPDSESIELHWFKLWLAFRDFNPNTTDAAFIYNLILKTIQYLGNNNVETFLKQHPLVVIALIMFSGESLSAVYEQGELENSPVTKEIFQSTLQKLPLLEMSLMSQRKTDEVPDITVYELLQDCTPFDSQKFFSWQQTEAVDLPHFSMPKLVSKYGYKCKLDYLYYLKQGRPSFAANTFLVEQFKCHKRLSKTMMRQASGYAHGVALQNFRDTCITSACVSFVEMLGANSEVMRVHITAANKILDYLVSEEQTSTTNTELLVEKVALLMHGLIVKNPEAPVEILSLLQSALLCDSAIPHSDSDSENVVIKAIIQWELAVKFAKIHKIKLPEGFLNCCAKKDMWLPFLMFVDIHQYPIPQVLELTKSFKSKTLQEHLVHAVESNITTKSQESITARKLTQDSRKQYYSKIGFKKGQKAINAPSTSTDTCSSSSEDMYSSQTSADGTPAISDSYSDNLLLVLLQCHNSPDPPRALLSSSLLLRNPILSVFANCYEPSSVIECTCTWLLSSLPPKNVSTLSQKLELALRQQLWTHRELQLVVEETVRARFLPTLERGFKIFLPDNPLCTFSTFLRLCVTNQDFGGSSVTLKLFKNMCVNLRKKASLKDIDTPDDAFLTNGYWLSYISIRLIAIVAVNCFTSTFCQQQFLRTLRDSGFSDNLPDAPDFHYLLEVVQCLADSNVRPDLEVLCSVNVDDHKQEIQRCISELLQENSHQKALNLAAITGIPKDDILIAQCLYDYTALNQSENIEDVDDFWKKWHNVFSDEQVNAALVAEFFRKCSQAAKTLTERYCILHLSLMWYQKARLSSGILDRQIEDEVEFEMWLCWIHLDTNSQTVPESTVTQKLCYLKTQLLDLSGVDKIQQSKNLEITEEILKLDSVIGKLLDQGDIISCCRLQKFFIHKNQDLQLTLMCMDLAEGQLTPYQLPAEYRALLNPEQRKNITGGYKKKSVRSKRLSSMSSASYSLLNYSISTDQADDSQKEYQDTLCLLEKLADCIEHGKHLVSRIIAYYRVSVNLGLTYKHVISLEDPLSLIRTTVENDTINKLVVVNDLVCCAGSTDEEVAELLCSEIVAAITRQHLQGGNQNPDIVRLWGYDLDANFHMILELCENPSLLGSQLLEVSNRFGSSQGETAYKVHKVIIELVIRAHDCFTAACDMEGIASVLRKSRILTTSLLKKEEWGLMVRLLTGVGRYMEMTYIFQILKENAHFELLLGKGLDKVRGLKVALLDFLRQFCPQDKDLFRLVVLHFSMFGDAANLWEADADEAISSALTSVDENRQLPNTSDVKQLLQKAVINYSDAARYYLKANKLIKAMAIAHKAELVALQISLLNSVPAGQLVNLLINLTAMEVSDVIVNKLSFPQACILARAYNHPTDWGAVLYQHCIVNREATYFSEFTQSMTLTTAHVEDIARRFQMEPNVTQDMAQEMKKFILHAPSVEVKYRIASQLGFKDIIQSLLNGPEVAYLKDTIWRKGFRRHNVL
ncbi:spatacsin [Schistocerca nitens]|uniref:spatacsin n=1 Tax=Schistocerca nitens TaxID=7011 RepID=UPI002118015D|nr:spatacsin [Schistocerca nitens]